MSCSEVIDLDTEQQGGDLVIFGRISNSTVGNHVKITRTQDGGRAPEPVPNASVKVVDQNGLEELLEETNPGYYEFHGNLITPDFGDSFYLEVRIGTKIYTSSIQEIQPIVAEDRLDWEQGTDIDVSDQGVQTETEVVRLFASSTLNDLPEEFYIRWTIEEAYVHLGSALPGNHFPFFSQPVCYVTNDLTEQNVFLLDGRDIRNTNLNDRQLISRRIDASFAVKHYFNLIQSSVNRETHDYWERVNALVERTGSIFDVPPAPIPSNIKGMDSDEIVLGHFEVIGVDTTRMFLTNNDIPYYFEDKCAIDTPRKYIQVRSVPYQCAGCLVDRNILPQECIFCALTPGYDTERPSYF